MSSQIGQRVLVNGRHDAVRLKTTMVVSKQARHGCLTERCVLSQIVKYVGFVDKREGMYYGVELKRPVYVSTPPTHAHTHASALHVVHLIYVTCSPSFPLVAIVATAMAPLKEKSKRTCSC